MSNIHSLIQAKIDKIWEDAIEELSGQYLNQDGSVMEMGVYSEEEGACPMCMGINDRVGAQVDAYNNVADILGEPHFTVPEPPDRVFAGLPQED